MPALIDTDVAIELMRQNPVTLRHLAGYDDAVLVSSITAAELFFGAYNSANPDKNVARTRDFLGRFQRVTVTDAVADRFGRLKAELRRQSVQVAPFDLMIASIALEHGCVLVTGNTRHFNRIEGLQIENWIR